MLYGMSLLLPTTSGGVIYARSERATVPAHTQVTLIMNALVCLPKQRGWFYYWLRNKRQKNVTCIKGADARLRGSAKALLANDRIICPQAVIGERRCNLQMQTH